MTYTIVEVIGGKFMECKYCKSMWTSTIKVECCPFCGNALMERDEYTISRALKKVIDDKGIEILNNSDMLIAYIMDYVKGDERNKKLLRIAAKEGILKLMLDVKNSEKIKQEGLIIRAIKVLEEDAFLSTENAVHIIGIISEGLDLEFKNMKMYKKTPSGETESVNLEENEQKIEDMSAKALKNIVENSLKCTSGECEDIFLIGRKKLGNKEEKDAIDYIRYASKHGHKKASILLGYCYDKGIGVNQDAKIAEGYYRQGLISNSDYDRYKVPYGWTKEAFRKIAEEGERLYIRSHFLKIKC